MALEPLTADLVRFEVSEPAARIAFRHAIYDGDIALFHDSRLERGSKTLVHLGIAGEEQASARIPVKPVDDGERRAIRQIMDCADRVNQYIDNSKPWVLAKDETRLDEVQAICTMGLNLFRVVMTYLKPVLPVMAEQAETFLNCPPLTFAAID